MTCITHFPEEKTSLILQLQLNLSNGFISWTKWIDVAIQIQGVFFARYT